MRSFLVFLMLVGIAFSQVCVSCNELKDAPEANIFTTLENENLSIFVSFDNSSQGEFIRMPIDNAIIIVEPYNDSHGQLGGPFRIYTDDQGKASFNFGNYADSCVNFKVLYCPFCSPDSPECGFEACMNYSGIVTTANTANELELAPGAEVRSPLNKKRFIPAIAQEYYCPPPPPLGATPSICFPLLLIFSLLAGAMYMTGRNPFASFNIGGARMGRHIRYQARGRGFSFSIQGGAASAALSIGQAAKTISSGGMKSLSKSEKNAAQNRVFGAALFSSKTGVGKGLAAAKGAKKAAKNAGDKAQAKARSEGKSEKEIRQAKNDASNAAYSKHFEARADVIDASNPDNKAKVMAGVITAAGLSFLPGGGGVRSGETVTSGKGIWANIFGTMGKMMMVVASQTTIGRLVDGFMYLGSGQGMLDKIGLTNHEKRVGEELIALTKHENRAGEDLLAVKDMMGEKGGLVVEIAGSTVIVHYVKTDAKGNQIFNVTMPNGDARQITIDDKGKVVAVAFELTITKDMASQIPGAVPNTTVSAELNQKGEIVVKYMAAPSEEGGMPFASTYTISKTNNPALFDAMKISAYSSNAGLIVGSNATDFQKSYDQNKTEMAAVVAAASLNASIAASASGKSVKEELEKNPETRQVVSELRKNMASEELALLGISPEALEGMKGSKGEKSQFGDRSDSEIAVMSVESSYRQSGIGTKEFEEKLDNASGFKKDDPNGSRVTAAVGDYMRSSSAEELSKLDSQKLAVQVEQRVAEGLVRQNPSLGPEEAKTQAQQIVAQADMAKLTDQVNKAGSGLVDDFNKAGLQDLSRANVDQIASVAQVGSMMRDDRAADVVAQSKTPDYRLSPELQAKVDQYKVYSGVQSEIQGISSSVSSGDFKRADEYQTRAVDTQNIYLHAKASEVIIKDPEVPKQAEVVSVAGKPTEMTITDEYQKGVQMAYEGTQMLHRMSRPENQAQIQYFANESKSVEEGSKQMITAAIQAGDYASAVEKANEMANHHLLYGNDASAMSYMRVAEQAGDLARANENRPEDKPPVHQDPAYKTMRNELQDTLTNFPPADSVSQRMGTVRFDEKQEIENRNGIVNSVSSNEYSDAISIASSRYKYHKEQGNTEQAEQYLRTIEEIGNLRRGESTSSPEKVYSSLGYEKAKDESGKLIKTESGKPIYQLSEDSQAHISTNSASTYSRAVQTGGEGYGHIIDSADRAGKYQEDDKK